jgi:TM2 domain-containing membrane protein YozV
MSVPTKCPQCGAAVDQGATTCKYCGETLPQQQALPQQYAPSPPPQQVPYAQQPVYIQQQANPINPSWPIKSKTAAGILAILLGGLGIHKFYLGRTGLGVLYLLFFWTYVPALIGLIEGIIYLTSNDHNFQVKNRVRIE